MKIKAKVGDIVVVEDYDGQISYADLVLDESEEEGYYHTWTFGYGPNHVAWDNHKGVRIV